VAVSLTVFGTRHGAVLLSNGWAFGPLWEDQDVASCFLAWAERHWMTNLATMADHDLETLIARWRETPPCADCGHPRGTPDDEGTDQCVACLTAARRTRRRGRVL
jgi:hypothetical protein